MSPAYPTRAEIARAVPPGSRRVRGRRIERTYLDSLGAFPELLELRRDARENTLKVAKEWARRASYADGTTRRGSSPWHVLAGVCKSTWKAARRRLEGWGFAGCVVAGTTPEFQSFLHRGDHNTAAVYVLAVPCGALICRRPSASRPVTRPPTRSSLLDRVGPTRKGLGKTPDRARFARAQSRAAALAAAEPLAGLVRKATGQDISDGWAAHLARPFLAAGYPVRDIVWAIEHDEHGRRHHLTSPVRNAAGWMRSRLARHLGPGGRPALARSLQLAVTRQKTRAAARRWRAAAEAASSSWADPAPRAAAIRQALGWEMPGKPKDFPGRRWFPTDRLQQPPAQPQLSGEGWIGARGTDKSLPEG